MRANAATLVITPEDEIDMGAGTKASAVRLTSASNEPLEINCLALWDGDVTPFLFFSIDALYPGDAIRTFVDELAVGVPPENILVAASHSHQAPMTDFSKPKLGSVNREWLQNLRNQIEGLITPLLRYETSIEIELFIGDNLAHHSINRRKKVKFAYISKLFTGGIVQIAPDKNGVVDETISVISVRKSDGTEIARIWNYACHPVSHPNPELYSSHYIGAVRDNIRTSVGNSNLPVLFFQGFSGNTRPNASVGINWNPKSLAFRLLEGQTFRSIPKNRYHKWVESLAVIVNSTPLTKLEVNQPIMAKRTVVGGNGFAAGREFSVSFAKISFDKALAIYAISAEVVAEYAVLVRAMSDARINFCVGCTDQTFGYIPTDKMLREGGYESGGYCESFSLTKLSPQIEETTRSSLTAIGLPTQ